MTSWLIYSSSHPQCRAHSGCSVFVEWKSKQIKRSFISSKGRARHDYSVFTGASDMLEDLEKWIWAKGKFSKCWGHSNPNRVSCRGQGGEWVAKKKKKSLEILPGLFCCPGFHCRSREAERSIHTQKKGPRGQPPTPIHQRWDQGSALQRVKEQDGPTVSTTLSNGQTPSFM